MAESIMEKLGEKLSAFKDTIKSYWDKIVKNAAGNLGFESVDGKEFGNLKPSPTPKGGAHAKQIAGQDNKNAGQQGGGGGMAANG